MDNTQEFQKPLTEDEIGAEIQKVGDFFKLIPEELKSWAAEAFIFEIVNWGSYNHYEALGIFQEAMLRYREAAIEVSAEEDDEEER